MVSWCSNYDNSFGPSAWEKPMGSEPAGGLSTAMALHRGLFAPIAHSPVQHLLPRLSVYRFLNKQWC